MGGAAAVMIERGRTQAQEGLADVPAHGLRGRAFVGPPLQWSGRACPSARLDPAGSLYEPVVVSFLARGSLYEPALWMSYERMISWNVCAACLIACKVDCT